MATAKTKNAKLISYAEAVRPFENEHSCRIKSPGLFKKGKDNWARVPRKSASMKKTYDVIRGILIKTNKWADQAYRYPIRTWPVSQARKH